MTTISATPQSTTNTSSLFARGAIIDGKRCERWGVQARPDAPLRWRDPRFVQITSDLFMDEHTDEMIDKVFAVMALAPQHTFQVLTKRPARMRKYCASLGRHHEIDRVSLVAKAMRPKGPGFFWKLGEGGWSLRNVWLGVSAENQDRADERIPDLLATPAAVRFVSAEPLLGPVTFRWAKWEPWTDESGQPKSVNHLDGLRRIDWVIVGGESGPGARPCSVGWIRAIKDECAAANVACFVKQLGAQPYICLGSHDRAATAGPGPSPDCGGKSGYGCSPHVLKDRKGGDPSEWPSDLRVRQMPEVKR